jgi:uncharacterized protein YqeY
MNKIETTKQVLDAKNKVFFSNLFIKRGLSATGLDNYLSCPWKFFYRNLLSFPDAKNKNQIYGTLMHLVMNRLISVKGKEETLTEDEMMSALMTEAKKRKDAIALYQQGGREDLATGEKNELAIISAYLPQQMSAQETEQAVDKILASLSVKEFGPAMKEVMKELKGKADAAVVTDLVKKKLG